MNIGNRIKEAIVTNLGWRLADRPQEVGVNKPNVLCCGEHFAIVTCTEDDTPYVEAMKEIVTNEDEDAVKFVVKQKGARVPAGTGFGDKVWRRNSKHNGIEVSFNGKPEDNIRENLKLLGFRWSHTSGVWYIGVKKFGEKAGEYLSGIGIKHVEDV